MQVKGRRRLIAGTDGFTLIEMIVAITILTVGILGVGQIFAVANRNVSFSRSETMAVSLAREIQEKILCESVDLIPMVFDGVDTSSPGSVTTPCELWAQHLSEQLGPTARGVIDVRDHTEDPELLAGMLSVRVEIHWSRNGNDLIFPVQFAVTNIGT